METDPILIRIQAIDEASQTINKVAKSLQLLQKVPKMDLGVGIGEYTRVNKILPKTTQIFRSQINSLEDIGMSYTRFFNAMDVEPIERLDETLQTAGITEKQFTSFLAQNNLEVIKGVGVYDKISGAILTQGQAIKLATIQARRFKFEWLSIMFAGMALDRTFGGLVRTQMQLFGVTDSLSAAWTITLLPIMELITPLIYTLLDAFMNLPEPVQIAIGAFVLIGAALGILFTIVGQFMLAWMGFSILLKGTGILAVFKIIFAAIITGLKFVVANFLPITLIIAGIAAAIYGVYLVAKGKFEGIGLIIGGIGTAVVAILSILGVLALWWVAIPIAVGAAVYLIIKYWDGFKSFFIKLWADMTKILDSFKKFFVGIWNSIKGIADNVWIGIQKGAQNLWNAIKIIAKGIANAFISALNFMITGINLWISVLETGINYAIKGLNSLIKLMNKIPGVNIRTIGSVNFGSVKNIPYFQKGGIMPETGLAFLHAGERVVPRNEGGGTSTVIFSPTINLNAEVSNDYDVRKLAGELNKYWAEDFQRMIRR